VSNDFTLHIRRFAATLVWLHSQPLRLNQTYLMKHLDGVKGKATKIRHRVNVRFDGTSGGAIRDERDRIGRIRNEQSAFI
jgi:sulfate adenylyltransferase subunit 1 (EFTu-like GTPase family)